MSRLCFTVTSHIAVTFGSNCDLPTYPSRPKTCKKCTYLPIASAKRASTDTLPGKEPRTSARRAAATRRPTVTARSTMVRLSTIVRQRTTSQNLNPGQDTRAEPKLEGHRNQIEHSEEARTQHSRRLTSVTTATLDRAFERSVTAQTPFHSTHFEANF